MSIRDEFEKAFDEEYPKNGVGSFNQVLYERKKECAIWAAEWALNYRGDELSKKLISELRDEKKV